MVQVSCGRYVHRCLVRGADCYVMSKQTNNGYYKLLVIPMTAVGLIQKRHMTQVATLADTSLSTSLSVVVVGYCLSVTLFVSSGEVPMW